MKVSSRTLKLLGAAVSVISIASVVWWASHEEAPKWPSSSSHLTLAGLGAVGYLIGCVFRAERWHLLLHFNGAEAKRSDCYALTAVGFMGNNVLPLRGGDVLRTVLLTPRAHNADARKVVGTLVAERVLDVVVLLGLFVIVAFGLLHGIKTPSSGRFEFAAIAIVVVLALGAVALVMARRRGALAKIVAWASPLVAATRNLRGRHGAEALGVTVLIWGTEVLAWFAIARSVDLDVSVLRICYLLSLASVFVLIPAGPGYAGTFDAAIIFGVKALNKGSSVAVSFLVLLRFMIFIPITVIGLVVLITRYGGIATMRRSTAEETPA